MIERLENVFEHYFDVPNHFYFDGEDYTCKDSEHERELESVRDMWHGFKTGYEVEKSE